jgi:hypothetical protein
VESDTLTEGDECRDEEEEERFPSGERVDDISGEETLEETDGDRNFRKN